VKEHFMGNNSSLPFESERHYQRLRTKLMVFLERRGCTSPDDVADEALARLVELAESRPIDDLDRLAFGIAKKVFLEWLRQSGRFAPLDDEASIDSVSGSRSFRFIAEIAVGALHPSDRELLEEYFIDGKKAEDLASRLGVTAIAVRGRVFRLRRRLQIMIGEMMAAGASRPAFLRPPLA
jgi:DNA-directed RNA polymerase specialized sigma24 family protein